jgi:hypothetical protein
MGIRTVRLDDEGEKALKEILAATRLSASAAMKRGLQALRRDVARQAKQRPWDIYLDLDLGPGGYAIAPSTQVRHGVRAAIRQKLR